MPAPGNEDYRLNEIERRLRTLEREGSPQAQRLQDRLDYEREVRLGLAKDLKDEVSETRAMLERRVDAIENTLTWVNRLLFGGAVTLIIGILIAVLGNGGP